MLYGKYNDLYINGDQWWSPNNLLPPLCKANLFQNPLPQKSHDEWKIFITTLLQPRMNLNIQVGNFFMNIKDWSMKMKMPLGEELCCETKFAIAFK